MGSNPLEDEQLEFSAFFKSWRLVFFLELGQVSVAWRKTSSQPTACVNSTPTKTARTKLHSMITFHQANTRGSRAGRLRIAHLRVPKTLSFTCHVSFFAAPDTDHKHKFSLTHLIYCLTSTPKAHDSRPIFTLRYSTTEWRINTNPISHGLRAQICWIKHRSDRASRPRAQKNRAWKESWNRSVSNTGKICEK